MTVTCNMTSVFIRQIEQCVNTCYIVYTTSLPVINIASVYFTSGIKAKLACYIFLYLNICVLLDNLLCGRQLPGAHRSCDHQPGGAPAPARAAVSSSPHPFHQD